MRVRGPGSTRGSSTGGTGTAGDGRLGTVSLRRRVVTVTVAVFAVLLLVVGVFVDVSLGLRLEADARGRLVQLAELAVQLDGTVDDRTLVDRLATAGASASLTSDGSTITGTPGAAAQGPPGPAGDGPPAPGAAAAAAVTESDGVLTVRRTLAGDRVLELATSLAPVREALDRFRVLMALGSVVGLVVAAAVLWWVLGRALRPLDTMTATARSITAGDRGRRLSPRRTDTELGRTAQAFDDMLDALEGAQRRTAAARTTLQQFLADAAHELRTPITGVIAGAERLLLESHDEDEDPEAALRRRARREETAVRTVREARRAGRLVADLLAVSRLEEVRTEPVPVDLTALAASCAQGVTPTAAGTAAPVEVAGAAAVVTADPGHLRQVLDNLLDNARRAAAGGRVRVDVDAPDPATVRLTVSDTGPGIGADDRERVFDRLVRLDAAREADVGGSGLGLAIARGLAQASGGRLLCVDPRTPGLPPGVLPGAVFTLLLPAADAPAALPARPASAAPAGRAPAPAGPGAR